jgi:hypothetical protein
LFLKLDLIINNNVKHKLLFFSVQLPNFNSILVNLTETQKRINGNKPPIPLLNVSMSQCFNEIIIKYNKKLNLPVCVRKCRCSSSDRVNLLPQNK